jgi:hypothetical protein
MVGKEGDSGRMEIVTVSQELLYVPWLDWS